MVQQVSLQAEPRQGTGKGPGRRLRVNGRIPAIVYGLTQPPMNVSVNARELTHLVQRAGEHAIVSLKIGGQEAGENVMMRELQRDPVTDRLIHADFRRIDLDKPIEVEIPVVPVGTPVGVKEGGLLEHLMRTVKVRCLPLNMPNLIEVDVSAIRIGHSLHVRELTPPPGVEFLTGADVAVFTVLAPQKEEEVVAVAAEAEVAEPELITKGKEEEEGEEEEGGKKEEAGKKEAKKEEGGKKDEAGKKEETGKREGKREGKKEKGKE